MNTFYKWKALYTLLLVQIPLILIAQKEINHPQSQQLLNNSNKSQFFIENKGQWPRQVKFLARLGGMNCWITDSGVVYDYYRIDRNYSPDSVMMLLPHEKDEFERTHTSCTGHVVKMDYEGINVKAEKQGIDKRETYYNYFIGNDSTKWASFVGLYGEVLVKDAFAGIDIRYYFDSGQIRYDYLIKPRADISQIKFRLTGADALAINESGELIIQTSLGEVKHGKIYAYQQYGNVKKAINCRFEKNEDGNFGVIASNYEKNLALVIDPLIWSTYLGGISNEDVRSLTIDQNNNTYITGGTMSTVFPTSTGAYQTSFQGHQHDAFVSKLNSSGSSLVFSTYLGGITSDFGYGIKVDSIGNSYITGRTASSNFPTSGSAYQTSIQGFENVFVTKLNSTGSSIIYSTFLGGGNRDYPNHLYIDSIGFAYIAGSTQSLNFPTTGGSYQPSYAGGIYDGFISKLNQNGSGLVYSTYLGGAVSDYGMNIKVDNSGNAYIAGYTSSSNFPTTGGSYQPTYSGGNSDVFISKLNSTGTSLIFSTFLGGNGTDVCYDIVLIDTSGFAVTGRTSSANFPTTSGSYQPTFNGNNGGFICQFNTAGSSVTYSTYIGGTTGGTSCYGITTDASGNKIISGFTSSLNYPVTGCSFQTNYLGGNGDAFVTKLSSDLSSLLYSTYIGSISLEMVFVSDVALDTGNFVYIAGNTKSGSFPTTPGAYSTSNSGLDDAFVLKLEMTHVLILKTGTVIGSPFCAGSVVPVSYYAPCQFDSGNIFTIQLSDSNGSFGSPITIGSMSSALSDTINCKIPENSLYGTGYRIRVIASNPSDTATDNGTNLTIAPLPKAGFSVNDSTQCLRGNNFIFTNTSSISSGNLYNSWNFGDADTSILTNPAHSYTTADSFLVRLIISSNFLCRDTFSDTMITYPMPVAGFIINDSTQCLRSNSFILTNTSTSAISYNWNFGDGDTSTQINTTHSYTTANTFNVKLVATSGFGCSDSISKPAFVYPQPIANFSVNDSTQCLRNNIFTFNNSSSIGSGSMTYLWKFGDTITSTTASPNHTYTTNNIYGVRLIATSDKGCTDSISKLQTVYPQPKARFLNYDSSQCLERNNFAFLNDSKIAGGTMTYLWKLGDGDTSTTYNPIHAYSTQGYFTVTLIATSDYGCNDSFQKNTHIHIHPEPRSQFSVNDTTQCLGGNNFVFTNNSSIASGTFTQKWEFNDGDTANTYNASHIYGTADTFRAKLLLISDWACKDSILKTIIVYPMPVPDFSTNDSVQCFKGNSFSFTNKSGISSGNLTYSWDFGDGNSSTATDPVHSYILADSFEVSLIAYSNYNCIDSVKRKVYVNPSPVADFSIDKTPQYLPYNKFTFTNNSIVSSGLNIYVWDFGDGNISTATDTSHSYSLADSFEVMLIANSDKGCTDTIRKFVYIMTASIVADFNVTNVCVGDTVFFQNVSQIINDTFLNFIWDFGDMSGTVISDNPYHIYKDTGTYTVKMIANSKNGFKDSISHIINILAGPPLNITYFKDTILYEGQKVVLTANGIFDLVLWSTGEQTSSIEVDSQGIYSVVVMDKNGCKSFGSIRIVVLERTTFSFINTITPNGDGINELFKIDNIKQYQPCKLVIYNRWGQELYSDNDYNNDWNGMYKGNPLPQATYYFVLETVDHKVYKGAVNIVR